MTWSDDFERGVRAGIEAFDAYFRTEDDVLFAGIANLREEGGTEIDWRHYSDAEFEGMRDGAARDALWDERNRVDRQERHGKKSDYGLAS